MKLQFMGHSPSKENPEWQTLENHVSGVTRRTEQPATVHADLHE